MKKVIPDNRFQPDNPSGQTAFKKYTKIRQEFYDGKPLKITTKARKHAVKIQGGPGWVVLVRRVSN